MTFAHSTMHSCCAKKSKKIPPCKVVVCGPRHSICPTQCDHVMWGDDPWRCMDRVNYVLSSLGEMHAWSGGLLENASLPQAAPGANNIIAGAEDQNHPHPASSVGASSSITAAGGRTTPGGTLHVFIYTTSFTRLGSADPRLFRYDRWTSLIGLSFVTDLAPRTRL